MEGQGEQTVKVHEMFQPRKLSELGLAKVERTRRAFSSLMEVLDDDLPASRESSLVRTHIETAAFFAVRAHSINPNNQA